MFSFWLLRILLDSGLPYAVVVMARYWQRSADNTQHLLFNVFLCTASLLFATSPWGHSTDWWRSHFSSTLTGWTPWRSTGSAARLSCWQASPWQASRPAPSPMLQWETITQWIYPVFLHKSLLVRISERETATALNGSTDAKAGHSEENFSFLLVAYILSLIWNNSGSCIAEFLYREKYNLWHIGRSAHTAFLYNLTGKEREELEATTTKTSGLNITLSPPSNVFQGISSSSTWWSCWSYRVSTWCWGGPDTALSSPTTGRC